MKTRPSGAKPRRVPPERDGASSSRPDFTPDRAGIKRRPDKLGLKQARRRQGGSKCPVPDTGNRQRKWTFTVGNHFGR